MSLAQLRADLAALASSLSPGSVLTPDGGADDLGRYERPWRGAAGRAPFVLRPASVEEVRLALQWAARLRQRLVVQGANTGLVGASVPGSSGTTGVLSTQRLVSPLTVHADDLAVTAGAGALLSSVAAACATYGLELPVDLAADASVGGIVATNAGGCRVLRHGDVRRRLLGVQVVLADESATVLGDLRPLRKKNDALRVTDLAVGSAGLFGVVTAATLALVPEPGGRATAFIRPGSDLAEVCAGLERVLGSRLGALELVSAQALRITVDRLDEVTHPFPGAADDDVLLVEAELEVGVARDAVDAENVLVEALDRLGPLVADAVLLPVERAWALRHGISEALARAGTVVGLDVSLPRAAVAPVRAAVAAAVPAAVPGAVLADFGHLGDGGLHLNIVLPDDVVLPGGVDPAVVLALRHEIYAVVAARGGSFSAEHGLGPANVAWWLGHEPAESLVALARVKAAVDPYGLLGTEALRDALTGRGR